MGEVWAATSVGKSPVAIKLMRRSFALDPESRRRFLREGRAIASLDHPGIVNVFDVGLSPEDRPFIAMEYLEGGTLQDYLRGRGALGWNEARSIIDQLASALGAAHRCGIIHRDVKPANVMIDLSAGIPRCTVIDFGLARGQGLGRCSTQLTRTGQVIGTPSYISPEALRGEAIDERSDIYALGCVAYELLAGRRPFEGDGVEELLFQHMGRPAPRPTLATVPKPLVEQVWAILQRALRKQPGHRFPTMVALQEAFAAVRVGAPAVPVPREVLRHVEIDTEVTQRQPPSPASRSRGAILLAFGLTASTGLLAANTRNRARAEVLPAESQAIATHPTLEPGQAPPPPSPRVIALATGIALSCALSGEGDVRCWGSDSLGRLGRGSDGSHVGDNERPADVPPLVLPKGRRVADLVSSTDARHVCILWADQRARCWGHNTTGQLGLGTRQEWGDDPHETVAALPDLPFDGIEQIATGAKITCVRLRGGDAHCWGYGGHGVRGDGSTEPLIGGDRPLTSSKIDVGPESIEQLALGRLHGCARLRNGEIRCFGANTHGQLGVPGWKYSIGDGEGNGRGRGLRPNDPKLAVHGLEDVEVLSVHTAADRSCVLTGDHGVRCWGRDAYGTLGYRADLELECSPTSKPNECDIDAPPPFDVDLGARIVSLGLGVEHTCAIDDEGGVRCWGHSRWGRLGDGEQTRHVTEDGGITVPPRPPKGRVVDLGDVDLDGRIDPAMQVHASNFHSCALMQDGGVRCWGRGFSGRLGYGSTDNVGDNETPGDYYARYELPRVPAF